jgi:ketosteroid isomerase-like protein
MTRTETEDLLRRVYQAYDEADVAVIAELTGENPTMHIPGTHPLAGVHEGQDAAWAYLGKVAEVSGGVGGFVVTDITADDDGHAVALLIGTIRDFVRPVAHVWRVEDGRTAEYWEVNFDQEAEDRFWTSALG